VAGIYSARANASTSARSASTAPQHPSGALNASSSVKAGRRRDEMPPNTPARNIRGRILEGVHRIVNNRTAPAETKSPARHFPRGHEFNAQRGKILQVNEGARHWNDGKNIFYIDLASQLIENDGTILNPTCRFLAIQRCRLPDLANPSRAEAEGNSRRENKLFRGWRPRERFRNFRQSPRAARKTIFCNCATASCQYAASAHHISDWPTSSTPRLSIASQTRNVPAWLAQFKRLARPPVLTIHSSTKPTAARRRRLTIVQSDFNPHANFFPNFAVRELIFTLQKSPPRHRSRPPKLMPV